MQKNRFVFIFLLLLLFALGAVSAAAEDGTPAEAADLVLGVGEQVSLPALSDYGESTLRYDEALLEIHGNAITALSSGFTRILSETDGTQTPIASVAVFDAPTSVAFPQPDVTTGIGVTLDLTASVNPGSASDLIYDCDNEEVLKPLGNGAFKAIHSGTAIIWAQTYNGLVATCEVTVLRQPKKLMLNQTKLSLGVGETQTLIALVKSDTYRGEIRYSSADPSIVKVNPTTGLLRAKAPGKTSVIATAYNGVSARCTVTVLKAPKKILPSSKTVTLGVGDVFTAAWRFPSGTFSSAVTTTSSNTKVLKPLGNNKFLAKKNGKATVTYRTHNGKTAVTTVSIFSQPQSISLKKDSFSLRIGEEAKLKIVFPAYTYSVSCTFRSKQPAVASVDEKGVIHANAIGRATIVARTKNGKTAKAVVSVSSMAVPFVSQVPKYPTGCEAACCTSLLNYYGYRITLDQMVDAIPRKNIVVRSGRRIGPDIHDYFVGDPRGNYTSKNPGYGAFAPCITRSLQKAINDRNGDDLAVNLTGCTFETLLSQVSKGRPVIVWATYQMMVPATVNSWYIPNGDGTYRYFEYPRGTHVFVLKGYSEDSVTLMDPYYGTRTYARSVFEARWNLLGNQAVMLMER